MDGNSKHFELNSGACTTDLESFRRLRNRDVASSVGTEDVNDHGTTEEAGGSRRYVDVHIPISMDETNPVARIPLISVSYLDPRLGYSSLSVPFPCLYAPQGSPGCDAGHGV